MSHTPGYAGPPQQPYAGPPQPPPAKSPAAVIVVIILVVLLVVFGGLALIGLVCAGGMAALLTPAVSAARDAAEKAQHKNNLRRLGISFFTYWDRRMDGAGPQSWDDLRDIGFLDEEAIAQLQERGVRVVWGLNRNRVLTSRTPRGEIILAYPGGPSPAREEVSVLMADGSVDEIPYAEIERRLSAWRAKQNE